MVWLTERLNVDVEEVTLLFGGIPTMAIAPDTEDLFDRMFNLGTFVEADGRYPKAGTSFVHPLHAVDQAVASGLDVGRLRAALQMSDDQLVQLIAGLAAPLGIDLDAVADPDEALISRQRTSRCSRSTADWPSGFACPLRTSSRQSNSRRASPMITSRRLMTSSRWSDSWIASKRRDWNSATCKLSLV